MTMPETPPTATIKADEERYIAEIRTTLFEQSKKVGFNPAPFERAAELLESLPPAEFIDTRVQLALDVTLLAGMLVRPDIVRRTLYAAFPAGGKLVDKRLERKWLSFAGNLETRSGNVSQALKYKVAALALSEEIKDLLGLSVEWANLGGLAGGGGFYEDAIYYSTVGIGIAGLSDEQRALLYPGVCINRANALFRMGRMTEATADVASGLASASNPTTAGEFENLVRLQYMLAELNIERGNAVGARAALHAASTGARRLGAHALTLQVERVQACLSIGERGLALTLAKLEELLGQARQIERTFGESSQDDLIVDILHNLERICRTHGDRETADKWLAVISAKLHKNAARMLTALAGQPILSESFATTAKIAEVDRYLQSKLAVTPKILEASRSPWAYLVGLAASASGAEDPTKEHGVRVARLAGLVAQELGVSTSMRQGIEAGCLVHDVGKVVVPLIVVLKTTPLETGEQGLYDAHPAAGAELVERVSLPEQEVVQNVVRYHHVSYVGDMAHSPPRGEGIPLEARIAAICDEYDSLVTGRPRRPAISSSDALRAVFQNRSRKFDPKIVDVFVEIVRRLQRTCPDLQAYLSQEAEHMEYFAMQRTLKKAAERALTAE